MVVRLTIRSREAGFSLIELLVVVAILSILSIGTVLTMFRTDDRVDLASRALLEDMTEARRLAMVTGVDHALVPLQDGWRRERRVGSGWKALGDTRFDGLSVISRDGAPRVIFGNRGETTGPDLLLSAAGRMVACGSETGGLPTCAVR